jgi:hypothetical protein
VALEKITDGMTPEGLSLDAGVPPLVRLGVAWR